MKTKQLIGIIITGVVVMAVGITGVASNVIADKMLENTTKQTSSLLKDVFNGTMQNQVTLPQDEFIGVLNIVGEIEDTSSSVWGSSGTYNHQLYMNYIDKMENADNNKGILLYVDSPGGGVYQSDELYLKLMEYKQMTNRPVWAYFASQACSGGYYISMAADKIYASRNCWTGSIGVIISLVNCKKLYDKLGIKEIDITSGKNKAMGSSGLDLTEEQYDILQSLVDEAYDQFVGIVSDGRHMEKETVRSLADGRIYSALQAKEKGMIDEIGSLEDGKLALTQEIGCGTDITFFTPENNMSSIFSSILGAVEEILPKSETELATDIVKNKGNGVLKYYAK